MHNHHHHVDTTTSSEEDSTRIGWAFWLNFTFTIIEDLNEKGLIDESEKVEHITGKIARA